MDENDATSDIRHGEGGRGFLSESLGQVWSIATPDLSQTL